MSRRDLTPAEAESLLTIAKRCPEVGGPLVYAARLAIEAYGLSLLYEEDCEAARAEEGPWWQPTTSQPLAALSVDEEPSAGAPLYLRVFPNPADLTVSIEWAAGKGRGKSLFWRRWGRCGSGGRSRRHALPGGS